MSKLEELIEQYCPDGVECMRLGDFATQWYRGAGIKKDEIGQEGIPCIRYGEIHTIYKIWFDKCVSHTDETKQPSKKYADYGDILFAITSEDIPFIGNSVAYMGKERIMVGGDIVVMKHTQNPKYISYALSTIDAIKQKGKGKVKSKVVHTSVPSLQQIVIPVPPLPVQEEIVRVLDTFTELQAELQAELQKRLQQYNYYRDNLLSFEGRDDIVYKKLGEVCEFRNGFAFKSNLFKNDGCPIIRITNISGHGVNMEDVKYFHMEDYPKIKMSLFEVSNGDILVAMSGATTGKIGTYKEEDTAYLNQRIGKFIPKQRLDNRFLYHFLLTQVNEMYRISGGGAQPNLSSNDLKSKILIPLPSLEEQKRIASILDRFDTLTNDLTSGLPAEMEKRRQQYEYYRDRLLTFKRL